MNNQSVSSKRHHPDRFVMTISYHFCQRINPASHADVGVHQFVLDELWKPRAGTERLEFTPKK